MAHIADMEGIEVGHVTDHDHHTGVTVALLSRSMPCGVDVRGGAPGTRETDVFSPLNLVETADAVVFSGGSAFGLAAASGAMRFLHEKGRGVDTGFGKVPIVPAAVIWDFPLSGGKVFPTEEWGYRACQNASKAEKGRGNVGAGAGATTGKLCGIENAMKSGIGSAVVSGARGLTVGALCVVNSLGDVYDPQTGKPVAGVLSGDKKRLLDARAIIHEISYAGISPGAATIVALVAVNGNLSKLDMNRIARIAHGGIARAVFPSHTMLDGDTIFAVAAGGVDYPDLTICGALAIEAMERAIIDAVMSAEGVPGFPSAREIEKKYKNSHF